MSLTAASRNAKPVAVVGSRNWITPPAELEDDFFPQKEWIIDALHERILLLPGRDDAAAHPFASNHW